jgi:hypothetical protein
MIIWDDVMYFAGAFGFTLATLLMGGVAYVVWTWL